MLHTLVMIKGTQVLQGTYPLVYAFYNYFAALDATKEVLKDGAKFPEGFTFAQYFVAGGEE